MTAGVFVAGVGITRLGRHEQETVKSLTAAAVRAALADAGADPAAIEAAFFANTRQPMLEGQNTVRGQIALAPLGVAGIPVVNVENACASGSSALGLALAWLRAGAAEVVLAVGAERMHFPDRPEKVAAAFLGGTDIAAPEAVDRFLAEAGIDRAREPVAERAVFMAIYAAQARMHMARYGSTAADLARIAAKNHSAAAHNPFAQYRTPRTAEEVLADREVIAPFTRAMCAPVSDGAAAAVLATGRGLARLGGLRRRAVRVRGFALVSATPRDACDLERHIGRRAAAAAWAEAGVGPEDVDVAEVHDATSFAELLQIENLGLCARGEVGAHLARGDFAPGGRVPVNASGGLVAKGHPVAATGLVQVHDLVRQLRGEAGAVQASRARIAVAENGGGFLGVEEAATTVTVLEAGAAA